MIVVGLDLSLTATGVALTTGESLTLKTRLIGMPRLAWLRDEILPVCRVADLVVVEGYSFNSRNGGEHLGELGGVIRLALHEAGVNYLEIAPAKLKRYACGAGNAKKDDVFAAAIRRLGYEGNSKDEADALWLRAMALDHYGAPVVEVPAKHREALAGVAWPSLTLESLT